MAKYKSDLKTITFFLLMLFCSSQNISAQNYANGTGIGALQKQIFWLTWNNGLTSFPPDADSFNITAGQYVWQFTPNVKVVANVSNIVALTPNSALRVYTSGSYTQDGLNVLYPGIKAQSLKDSLFAGRIKFDISVDLQLFINGTWKSIAYPGMVVGDAESLADGEYVKASTGNTSIKWQLLELRKESYSPNPENYYVTISNSGQDCSLSLKPGVNDIFMQAIMFAKSANSLLDVETKGRGYTAVAVGIVAPFDFGDAPSSFGESGHYMADSIIYNSLPTLVDSVYKVINLQKITLKENVKVFLGTNYTDADGTPPHSIAATLDNTLNRNDEDGFSLVNQPLLQLNNASNLYFNVTVTNNQPLSATLYGWIDFNTDGKFSVNEVSTLIIPPNTVNQKVSLKYDYAKYGGIIKAGTTYARFRITTTPLIDNVSTAFIDERSTSVALDGEAEDYKLKDIVVGIPIKPVGTDDADTTLINIPVTVNVKGNDTINAITASVTIASNPVHGSVSVNGNGTIVYTPNNNYTGYDFFTYTLTSPDGAVSAPINVQITVLPNGVDDKESTKVNTPVVIPVKANDGGSATNNTVIISSNPSNGTVIIDANGNIVYTPSTGYTGFDTCTYTLNTPDGVVSAPITVIIEIKKTNTADVSIIKKLITPLPLTVGQIVTFSLTIINKGPDSATSIVALDTLNSNLFNAAIVSTTKGVANYNSNNNIITWNINGLANNDTATLLFTAIPKTVGILSNAAIVSANEIDPVKSNNIDSIKSTPINPQKADITIIKKLLSPLPIVIGQVVNFSITIINNGPDSALNVVALDTLSSNLGVPTISTPLQGVASFDAGSKAINWSIGSMANKDTVKLLFACTAGSGNLLANTANTISSTIDPNTKNNIDSISKVPIYSAPIGVKDYDSTKINTPKVVVVKANDGAAAALDTVKTASNPTHGNVTLLPNGSYIYTPNTGYTGKDTFTYTLTSPNGVVSAPIIVQITVLPIGVNDRDSTNVNTPVVIPVKANDGGSANNNTVIIASNPAHGTVLIDANGNIVYTPSTGYTGFDTCTYTLNTPDGVVSAPITVVIEIKKINTADVSIKKKLLTPLPLTVGQIVTFSLTVINKGPDSATSIVALDTLNSNLINTAIVSTTKGLANYNSSDNIITWNINGLAKNDSAVLVFTTIPNVVGTLSNAAIVSAKETDPVKSNNIDSIKSTPINPQKADIKITKKLLSPLPIVIGQVVNFSITIINNGPDSAFNVVGLDTLSSNLSVPTITTPLQGVAAFDAGSKAINWSIGSMANKDTVKLFFVCTVGSGNLLANTANTTSSTIDPNTKNNIDSISKVPIYSAPIGVNDYDSTKINTPKVVVVKANDGAAAALDTVKTASPPLHGNITLLPNGSYIYTPNTGYTGKDTFTYTLTSAVGLSSTPITVFILVKPVGINDSLTTPMNTTITENIVKNDGASGVGNTIQIINNPTNGNIIQNSNGTITYTPNNNYLGTDNYQYVLVTPDGVVSAPITVFIKVLPVIPKYANLGIIKSVLNSGLLSVGSEITYQITVTNFGLADATGVVAIDSLPRNLGNINNINTPSGDATYDPINNKIIWTIGNLFTSEIATLVFTATINSGNSVTNAASVIGNEKDTVPVNNYTSITKAVVNFDLFIPNVITPNSDGKNDQFVIKGLAKYPNSEISIFNRWDNLVYTSPNYSNNWDGKGLSTGTYFYVLKLKLPSNEIIVKKGSILLLK